MYFTLLVVVILTAIALVAVALGIARAISPRSYNSQKGEAYECGIPTRGRSWMLSWSREPVGALSPFSSASRDYRTWVAELLGREEVASHA